MLAFWQVSGSVVMSSILIILSAFFIYGPQALLGIACSNQATKRAAATANGICGLFCYLSPIVSGIVFGAIADSQYGWDLVFLLSVIFGLIGAAILAVLWKQPATGYEKMERIIAEEKAK